MNREMTLNEALAVLCEAHINNMDDDRWFVDVPSGAPAHLHHPMIQAWTVIRQHDLEGRETPAEQTATAGSSTPR